MGTENIQSIFTTPNDKFQLLTVKRKFLRMFCLWLLDVFCARREIQTSTERSIEHGKFIQFTCRQRLCVMNIKKINCFIYPKVFSIVSHSSSNILEDEEEENKMNGDVFMGMSFDTRRTANKRRGERKTEKDKHSFVIDENRRQFWQKRSSTNSSNWNLIQCRQIMMHSTFLEQLFQRFNCTIMNQKRGDEEKAYQFHLDWINRSDFYLFNIATRVL